MVSVPRCNDGFGGQGSAAAGRDSALALGWTEASSAVCKQAVVALAEYRESKGLGVASESTVIKKHLSAVVAETVALEQMALAAKVMAKVTLLRPLPLSDVFDVHMAGPVPFLTAARYYR